MMIIKAMSKTTPKTAIILVNLGTPDAPTPQAVRTYLREFLSDRRVIEIPALIWQVILNVFVLTTRPKKVAHAYASIWQDDSPIRQILRAQAQALSDALAHHPHVLVCIATTYGNPNITTVIQEQLTRGVETLVILPLYPQYSATTTGAVFDKLAKQLMTVRNLPSVHFIKEYHDHPLYIEALADSIKTYWAAHGRADKLLMSFHGIPKPYADKGDPYERQCHTTATKVAQALNLQDDEWAISFQSRFGAQEWLKPYTDELLTQWGQAGVESVQVLSPAFSADCLETLEELAVENKDIFLQAGGKAYAYIPALNDNHAHIVMMAQLVERYLSEE